MLTQNWPTCVTKQQTQTQCQLISRRTSQHSKRLEGIRLQSGLTSIPKRCFWRLLQTPSRRSSFSGSNKYSKLLLLLLISIVLRQRALIPKRRSDSSVWKERTRAVVVFTLWRWKILGVWKPPCELQPPLLRETIPSAIPT